MVFEHSFDTLKEKGPSRFVTRAAGLVKDACAGKKIELCAGGIGIAGDVDSKSGIMRFSPNIREFDGFDFKSAFSKSLKLPVTVDNDANAAVWGAYVSVLKRKPKNVIGVTLGTGVGGGLILDGRLYRGSTSSAGELGHARVAFPGEPCGCGATGCLEAYAGALGIARTARRLLGGPFKRRSLLL